MNPFTSFIIILFLSNSMFMQSQNILLDGYFDDWEGVETTITDVSGEDYAIDILECQVTNDEEYLYFHVKLNTEISLTSDLINHSFYIYIDTDNDSSTGYSPQSGYGTELGMNFKQRFAYYNVNPFSTVNLNGFGVMAMPTVTSDEFEIAIPRNAIPDQLNPLFPSETIKITFQETIGGDYLPNDGQEFSYTFSDENSLVYEPLELNKENTEEIRILAYNTLFDGITDSQLQGEYQRILQAVNPDVIGFSECAYSTSSQVKSRLDQWLPLGTTQGWYVTKDDYDLVTASRWDFLETWESMDRQYPVLIDLPSGYEKDLLFTNSHLKCCAGDGQRQLQVDEYAAFILDAKTAGGIVDVEYGTPIVYAGDLNLVGYQEQLETLKSGIIQNTAIYGEGDFLDWDNTDNLDLTPLHTDSYATYTWKNGGSTYLPSRIDYIIYSDAVVQAEKSFVLNTREMSETRLETYNLEENDTYYASDHLPIVLDFTINTEISVQETKQGHSLKVYPNPTQGKLFIDLRGFENTCSVQVYNFLGQQVFEDQLKGAEIHRIHLEGEAGVFQLLVSQGSELHTCSIIVE